jgi:hypothetical protein
MFKKMLLTSFVVLLLASVHEVRAQLPITIPVNWQPPAPVREGTDYAVPYAGFTSFDQFGPYIVYNPRLYGQYPQPMLVFLRAHEYGHIYSRGPFANPEANADCWAAAQLSRTDPQILGQVIWYLENVVGPRGGDATHGNGFQMAQLIRQCVVR